MTQKANSVEADRALETARKWEAYYETQQPAWKIGDVHLDKLAALIQSAMNAQERELLDERYALRNCLRRMIQDLPMKRDWLDPDTEREARRLLAKRGEGR